MVTKLAFKISIARGALETIFDECDRYDMNEETRITLRQVGVLGDAATPLASTASQP